MNERDLLIWAAGFCDGEGCFAVCKAKQHKWFTFTFQISVSQKTETPLKRLQEMFGGHLFSYQSRGVTYYRWQQWSNGALEVAKRLLPYLLVKREIAEVCVRFQEQMTAWNKQYGRRGYPNDVVVGREAFYLQARELNARNRANHRLPKYSGPESGTSTVQ